MSSWIIQTMEYDVDLGGLLSARLREGGAPFALSLAPGGVGVRMEGRQGLLALAQALGAVLIHDLVPFEVAAMTDETPLDREDRRQVMGRAVMSAFMISAMISAISSLITQVASSDAQQRKQPLQGLMSLA